MNSQSIEIDISIVTYNSAKWIDGFRDSLVNQEFPKANMNIYITDNNSTDDTYEKLLILKEEIANQFKKIEIYKEENLGFGHGHNNNIFQGNSKFILVTNIDLEFEVSSIISVVEAAIHDEVETASWELRQKPFEHPKCFNPVTLETSWSSSACILFRRAAIEKIGGYEKRIFMYAEDVELSYRLRDAGYKLKYCPKAVCWHYTYEHENQVKPLQFLGSLLGNMYIRLRFGDSVDITRGFAMFFALLFIPQIFVGQRIGLIKNWLRLIYNMPYFLRTRKTSGFKFKFIGWDYEIIRDGAFYSYQAQNNDHKKLVSVIVRTYGERLYYLKEAIASIANQTYSNIETIIIEDGTNNVAHYVNGLYIRNVQNIIYKYIPKAGRCKAGNIGLALANGEYIVFLDDDDLFYPDHIEVLVNELNSDDTISAAYANAFEVPTKIIGRNPFKYIELSHNIIYRQTFSRPLMWHHNYIPIQTILFKKELYEQYGGLDEELENLEDWNLWTKYSLQHDFKYLAKTTSLYRVPADTEDFQNRQHTLDNYYNKAIEKQRNLKIETNPIQIVEYYMELNKNMNILQVSVTDVKSMFKKHNILKKFYYLARKVYYKFKK